MTEAKDAMVAAGQRAQVVVGQRRDFARPPHAPDRMGVPSMFAPIANIAPIANMHLLAQKGTAAA